MNNEFTKRFPGAEWQNEPLSWSFNSTTEALSIVAPARSDLIHEPLHSAFVVDAPALLFPVTGDFALSAHVSLVTADGRWSAGTLLAWQDKDHWAKVCLERNHRGVVSVITVVTNGWSDDGVHWPVGADDCFLRIMRTGESLVMHSSVDGKEWEFVRVFRFQGFNPELRVGFLVQAPWGETCDVLYENIELTKVVPADVRDGT